MTESLALVFDGTPGQLDLQRFPTPEPGIGEILVQVLGCTICGSDLHSVHGRRTVPTPTILGHEIVGRIVQCGEGAPQTDLDGQPLTPGDRVTWAIVAHCGECFYCRRGLPQKCSHAVKYGHEALRPGRELLGGMAQHCLLVRGTSLVKLPEDLPLAVACPANCATATVAAALEAVGELHQRTVVILGAGLLGLTAAAMVKAAGGTAICIDPQPARRERARQFGALHAIPPESVLSCVQEATEGQGADAVLELSGAASGWDVAWPLVRTGGRLVLVGAVFPGPAAAFPQEQLIRRHLSVFGIHNYAPRHLLAAVRFLSRNDIHFPFEEVVAGWYGWNEVAECLAAAQDPDVIRVGLAANG